MPETNIPPEFEQQVRQALDVPEPDLTKLRRLRERFIAQGAAQLRQAHASHVELPRKGLFSRSTVWKFALVSLGVLILLVTFSPQMAQAIRNLFGYIPGVGMVNQTAEVLVLDEPVQAILGGVPLTVERAFATHEKTVVVYQYKPPQWDGKKYQQAEPPDRPALLLPDGSRLDVVMGRRQPGDDGFIRYALEFGPLPPDVTAATLFLDRLAGMPSELSPKQWSIPLRFKPGDPSEILFPVTEYQPTAATAPADARPAQPTSEPATQQAAPATAAAPAYGASFVLEKSVELPDGYLLMGSFRWTDPLVGANDLELGMPVISDANGQIVEYEFVPPDTDPQPGELWMGWAFKIPQKTFAAPLRVEFYVVHHEAASVPFHFDPGPNPPDGQTYDLNVALPVNTHPVNIISARHEILGGINHAFLFTLTADTYVIGARIIDPAHPPMGGGGGGNGIPPTGVPFTSGVVVEGDLSPGPLALQIVGLDVLIPGDWVITWSPGK